MASLQEAVMTDSQKPSGTSLNDQELDEKYPNRPRNRAGSLPFHDLFQHLFNPLNDNKKKPTGPAIARKKVGPHGPLVLTPHERRRAIIERFISRWRQEVGHDIYPAFRLILPEKDRDRGMYGIKEKTIGKLLVKTMKIDKNSDDGSSLLNWKLPGRNAASRMAGDFAGRCFEVISKRPMRVEVGSMSIDEVNDLLDKLSLAQKEDAQSPIFEEFYVRMNAEELLWLVRIMLRQVKIGATERTIFDVWHPDAENLFSISSSLRRVCWELYDPNIRLEGDDCGITLMQCFQPQLAQFQMHSFEKMVERMRPTENEGAFWIEEKLDGERMQLHMVDDPDADGGKRFCFWSRKAKDYTYLYGSGFMDAKAALTRYLKEAFHQGVDNLILDGEMITWDPAQDTIVPFGTLKTAALNEQRNPFSNTAERPLFRVFDILYLNNTVLTSYTLRDRRKALEASVKSVHRRFEIHSYQETNSVADIEPALRKVVSEASEGLVLKNPRSPYRLNERNDDWMKVKPDYMTDFGESFDCVVIGGFYGSGKRGGNLASFLCGLRVDENHASQGNDQMKCYSFVKVGGGFTASDYATVRHLTDGKWKEWDPKRPPKDYIELAGRELQYERPDVWIKPSDSVVLSVKAASISVSDQFRLGFTLRFPRFKQLRNDKNWSSALSVSEFMSLKTNIEKELKKKAFMVDDSRKKRARITRKKPITVDGGNNKLTTAYGGPQTKVFEGLSFYIMTESLKPYKRSKAELEQAVKANGGKIFQTYEASPGTICIADKNLVKVASLQKTGKANIIRPSWLLQCITQSEIDGDRPKFLLPWEPSHMFSTLEEFKAEIDENIDENGDSFARDVTRDELRTILDQMPQMSKSTFNARQLRTELEQHGQKLDNVPGWMFEDLVLFADTSHAEENGQDVEKHAITASRLRVLQACNTARFAGARVTDQIDDELITHVVVEDQSNRVKYFREQLSARRKLPRLVTAEWIEESWKEKTLLDEERFLPR